MGLLHMWAYTNRDLGLLHRHMIFVSFFVDNWFQMWFVQWRLVYLLQLAGEMISMDLILLRLKASQALESWRISYLGN